MKKFYVMLAALIVALSASADYPDHLYIFGNINNLDWSPSEGFEMTNEGNGIYTATLNVTGTRYFGITPLLNGNWDSVNAQRYRFASQDLSNGSVNLGSSYDSVFTPETSEYEITLNLVQNTISATKVVLTNDKVYLIGDFNNSNNWQTTSTSYPFLQEENGKDFTLQMALMPSTATNSTKIYFRVVYNGVAYGPTGSDETLSDGIPATNVVANGNKAYEVATAGVYTISFNIDTKQLVINKDDLSLIEDVTGAPSTIYIYGDYNSWNQGNAQELERIDNITIDGVQYADFCGVVNFAKDGSFCFGQIRNSDWNTINSATRYGPATATTITNIPNGVKNDPSTRLKVDMTAYTTNPGSCPNYSVAAGEYIIHLLFSSEGQYMTIAKVVNSDDPTVSVEGIAAAEEGEAVYYTLQGVKVAEPESGLYIKVVNGKAEKVLVRK